MSFQKGLLNQYLKIILEFKFFKVCDLNGIKPSYSSWDSYLINTVIFLGLDVSFTKGPSKTASDTTDSLTFPQQITSWFLVLTGGYSNQFKKKIRVQFLEIDANFCILQW